LFPSWEKKLDPQRPRRPGEPNRLPGGIEGIIRLSDSEREALVRDCARKLYVAATRAGQRLVISCVGELPEVIGSILSPGPE
jgi:hypothetical protein